MHSTEYVDIIIIIVIIIIIIIITTTTITPTTCGSERDGRSRRMKRRTCDACDEQRVTCDV